MPSNANNLMICGCCLRSCLKATKLTPKRIHFMAKHNKFNRLNEVPSIHLFCNQVFNLFICLFILLRLYLMSFRSIQHIYAMEKLSYGSSHA